jgi:hypothetical protein
MGPEARLIVLVSAILCAFGLAVLYSSSAFVAVADHGSSMFFFIRQVEGLAAGILMFLLAAKLDAEKLRRWAWPVMWFTIVAMAAVLVLPGHIAPTIHGSKRFLFGASFQPSEFAKLAVVVWVSMLIVKKGENLRRFTKGLIPFVAVIGVLDVLAAMEPDLSVAMLLTLLMALLLYVGGARLGHFIALGAMCLPMFIAKVEKWRYALSRITAFLHPGNAPEKVSFQLNQSLIAVGSGGWFGRGFGEGNLLCALPLQRLRGEQRRRGVGFPRARGNHDRFRVVRAPGIPHRAAGADAIPAARGRRAHVYDSPHGVPAHRRRDRPAPDHWAHASIRVVRSIEPRADASVHGHPREHRQYSRAYSGQRGD